MSNSSLFNTCFAFLQPSSLIFFGEFQEKFQYFIVVDPQANEAQIDRFARVWLWHFLGAFLFPDASGNTISWIFLDIRRQPWENISAYSWSSAVLAWMYRQLCVACRHTSGYANLGGCSYLLQVWCWERWPIGRPLATGLPVSTSDHYILRGSYYDEIIKG